MDKSRPEPRDRVDAAVVAVVARDGVGGVSVRKVAAQAGVSIGMVQHHHPTKQAMLAAAFETVSAAFARRTREAVAGRSPREALHELARQLVPLDETRATEGRVWLAFVAAAAVDPRLAARHRRDWAELEDLLAELVARARDRGTPTARDRADAGAFLALLDGLAVGGVVEPGRLPPARLEAIVAAALPV